MPGVLVLTANDLANYGWNVARTGEPGNREFRRELTMEQKRDLSEDTAYFTRQLAFSIRSSGSIYSNITNIQKNDLLFIL